MKSNQQFRQMIAIAIFIKWLWNLAAIFSKWLWDLKIILSKLSQYLTAVLSKHSQYQTSILTKRLWYQTLIFIKHRFLKTIVISSFGLCQTTFLLCSIPLIVAFATTQAKNQRALKWKLKWNKPIMLNILDVTRKKVNLGNVFYWNLHC